LDFKDQIKENEKEKKNKNNLNDKEKEDVIFLTDFCFAEI